MCVIYITYIYNIYVIYYIYIYTHCVYVCACVCVYTDQVDQLEKDFKTSKATEREKDKEVDEAWEKMRYQSLFVIE
jgi:hypothetical protein